MFGEETLDSVCIYHGSKEGWNRLNLDNLPSSIANSEYKKGSRCIQEGDDTHTSLADIMTEKDYKHIMKGFEKLSKDELAIFLLERDEQDQIRSKVTGLTIGPSLLEQCLCVLQYYLRRFTSGYNVSQKNEFDRPNFQPLLFQVASLRLTADSDPFLWDLMEEAISVLKRFAGLGETWDDVLRSPDPLFLIDEERKLIEAAKKKRDESDTPERRGCRKSKRVNKRNLSQSSKQKGGSIPTTKRKSTPSNRQGTTHSKAKKAKKSN
jgi:hypothetical protein